MELHWPLILFTFFIAWACGLLGTQSVFALKKAAPKAQKPSLIATGVLLVVGGLAVFTHLQNWERIFNGFGHITSGITQELICIVLMVVIAVILFAYVRKDAAAVPTWVAVVALVISLVTAVVTAHSYVMAARPAWDSMLWLLYMVGNVCVLGPLTFAIIDGFTCKDDTERPAWMGLAALAGTVLNAVTTLAYVFSMPAAANSVTSTGYYLDPTEIKPIVDPATAINIFAPEHAVLLWVGIVILGVAVPVVAALLGRMKGSAANWKLWGSVGLAGAIVGAICVRVLFFTMGVSTFIMF